MPLFGCYERFLHQGCDWGIEVTIDNPLVEIAASAQLGMCPWTAATCLSPGPGPR
jgi:hypothetical protein